MITHNDGAPADAKAALFWMTASHVTKRTPLVCANETSGTQRYTELAIRTQQTNE